MSRRDVRLIASIGDAKIDAITVKNRQRPICEAVVLELMTQIAERGLENPIAIRKVKHQKGALVLLAGAHRLEAVRRLGWDSVTCRAYDCSDAQARRIEIDENLVRSELAPLDLATALAEREEIHIQEAGGNGHGGDRKSHQARTIRKWSECEDEPVERHQVDTMSTWSFAAIAAANTGLSERHVRRLVCAGKAILLAGVKNFRVSEVPPKVTELIAFSKLSAQEQIDVATKLATGEVPTITSAIESLKAPLDNDPEQQDEPDVSDAVLDLVKHASRLQKRERTVLIDELVKAYQADIIAALARRAEAST
ncbi:MAG: ParB N-terminal domain-containing protein [Pseudomonadota bacterium]